MVGKRTQTPLLCPLESVCDVRKVSSRTVWRPQLQPGFYIFDSIHLYWESYGWQKTFFQMVRKHLGRRWELYGRRRGAAMLHGVRIGAIKSQLTAHYGPAEAMSTVKICQEKRSRFWAS